MHQRIIINQFYMMIIINQIIINQFYMIIIINEIIINQLTLTNFCQDRLDE